jgi:chemotaxis protein methyltransferase CheR
VGGGLGTAIVEALVKQLKARMDVVSTVNGLNVAITCATTVSKLPQVA